MRSSAKFRARLLLAVLVVGSQLYAQTNVIPEGLPVVLISSTEHAAMGSEVDLAQKIYLHAMELCDRLNKSLVSYKKHETTEAEASQFIEEESYQARVVDWSQEGLVLESGTFPVVEFHKPVNLAEIAQMGFYGGSFLVLVGGGLTSFFMVIGFDGPADHVTATILGCASVGVSALCAAGGFLTGLYRKYFRPKALLEEFALEAQDEQSIYAMPVLIDELWCE